MMMSRITIDLKKRASSSAHYGRSNDPMVADEGGPYQHTYQMASMQFRDPRETTRGGNTGDTETVTDTETAVPVSSQNQGATIDEILRPTRNPDGDQRLPV
jgi:hypothetical protein